MINSPRQADDDADNQSGDNRGDSAHTSISDRSARFFEFCNQAVSLARTDHNQRPAGSPDIAATVDCLTDITTINHSKAPRSLICCNATAS